MATTSRSTGDAGARRGDQKPFCGRLGARGAALLAVAAAAAPLLAPPCARAERWSVDAGVSSQLTWSSNGELGIGNGREDAILDLRPHLTIRAEGPRLRLSGSAALSGITSANGTQPSRVLPQVELNARLEAIERLLFLEAGVRALQTSQNPFGALPEAATSQNTLTTTLARFSPSIEAAAGPRSRYRLRSDNSWTHESGSAITPLTSAAAGYFGRHSLMFEQDPRPLGWRLEAERSVTRYRDQTQPSLNLDLARASVDYALTDDFSAGVRVGREHTSLVTADDQRTLYGVQARWQPSPRTQLSVFEEKRFFGPSWRLGFDHRTPQIAWNIVWSRTLDTAPQSLFDLPASENVAALLDAIFTSRYPDPIERARAVQDFIARQGLPTSTLHPTSLFAQRLSLVNLRNASVALIGVRNTVTLAGFESRTEDAADAGSFAGGTAATNNTQQGASLSLTHRLTPQMGMTVSADWSRIQALRAPDRTTQRAARAQLNLQLSPKTGAFIGARYRKLESNVTPQGHEGAVSAGLDHRF